VDALFVYGGGSILMKRVLHEKLAEVCTSREIDLFYCPEEQAVTLEAKGLYKFATSTIFTTLKEKARAGGSN
jgi:plasmid segregation protein ParM